MADVIRVSIPYRYALNNTEQMLPRPSLGVSIPYRYALNENKEIVEQVNNFRFNSL